MDSSSHAHRLARHSCVVGAEYACQQWQQTGAGSRLESEILIAEAWAALLWT